jgi:ribosomal protein L37AE/L43A
MNMTWPEAVHIATKREFPVLLQGTYEAQRSELAKQITKARVINDHRMVVILCRRFIDAFPSHGLVPIERAVREVFRESLRTAKDELTHICPVCKTTMYDQLCPDDITRPYCAKCGKTYKPRGYDDEDTYALEWIATTWTGTESAEVIRI